MSKTTPEEIAKLAQKHGARGFTNANWHKGIVVEITIEDFAALIDEVRATQPPQDERGVELDFMECPNCNGSGESSYLSDNGPDAYEIPCDCPHCNGTGTLEAAYKGVLGLLEAEQRKYMNVCRELWTKKHLPAPAQQATPPQPVAAEVEKDAARYRWLREQNWDDGMLCVVRDPIKNLRLGADCPSLIRLDNFIDAAMAGTGSDKSKKESGNG